MAKFPINTLLLLSRRTFTVAAENVKVMRKEVVAAAAESGSSGKESPVRERELSFWMRDPKTGNWIPESHFEEIDVAELRHKFLPKKANL